MTEKRQRELIQINRVLAVLVVVLALTSGFLLTERESVTSKQAEPKEVQREEYPVPVMNGVLMLESPNSPLSLLLKQARYQRQLTVDQELSKEQLLSIIWSGQGEITEWGERTAPSYKSQFPVELRVLVRRVSGVASGWYKFEPGSQQLLPLKNIDIPTDSWNSPVTLSLWSISPNPAYPEMMWHESGEIAQNILLMIQELKLAAGFDLVNQNQELWKIFVGKATL